MKNIKHILLSIWQPLLILLLLFLLFQNSCNRPNIKIESEAKQNADSSAFYKDRQLSEAKETKKFKRKADSLQNLIKSIYFPRWKNRTKITAVLPITDVKQCNDTIEKIIKTANENDAKCDTLVDYLSHTLIEKDSVIDGTEKQVQSLLLSHIFKDKQIGNLNDIIVVEKKQTRKERRKKNFWKTVTIGLSGLLIYQTIK